MGKTTACIVAAAFGAVTSFGSSATACDEQLAHAPVAYDEPGIVAKATKLRLVVEPVPSSTGARYRVLPEGNSTSWILPLVRRLDGEGISVYFGTAVPEGRFAPPKALYLPHESLDGTEASPAAGHELRHALVYRELWACRARAAAPPPPLPVRKWDPEDRSMAHGTVLVRFYPKDLPTESLHVLYGGTTGHGADEVHYAYSFEALAELGLARRTRDCAHVHRAAQAIEHWRALWASQNAMVREWSAKMPPVKSVADSLYDREVTLPDGSSMRWNRRQAERRQASWELPLDEKAVPKLVAEQLASLGRLWRRADVERCTLARAYCGGRPSLVRGCPAL